MAIDRPLVIQSDNTLMLETNHIQYEKCRDFLVIFAELVKSPEYIHTYRVTPLSLWNAASIGISLDEIIKGIYNFSRYEPPQNVISNIKQYYAVYGKLILEKESEEYLKLKIIDDIILNRIDKDKSLERFWSKKIETGFLIKSFNRGELKQSLIKIGYPVCDLCGYISGDVFNINLRKTDTDGNPFFLRDYQKEAVDIFYQSGRVSGGSGIIVLPCGSGKTIIGLGVICEISNKTLIITTNNISVHQWRDELLLKTDISSEDIGEFTGIKKSISPITITTYQMLTHRRSKNDLMEYLDIFSKYNWGLIIYDEVHLLPAPIFRATTFIQTKRRLGLTATLIREDGKEDEVFALIGPKRYDVPWKTLESRGFIAQAVCIEYRILMPKEEEINYANSDKKNRFRIAAENTKKISLVEELIYNHSNDKILIIGQYITQLEQISKKLNLPLITGKTKHSEREKLYDDFNKGAVKVLVVSKVANFAVDLPDANVMFQVSGTFGSRQEEAQRLGRILRPKKYSAYFYTLVSKGTDEQMFAVNRQLFLVEQGYKYLIRYYEFAD